VSESKKIQKSTIQEKYCKTLALFTAYYFLQSKAFNQQLNIIVWQRREDNLAYIQHSDWKKENIAGDFPCRYLSLSRERRKQNEISFKWVLTGSGIAELLNGGVHLPPGATTAPTPMSLRSSSVSWPCRRVRPWALADPAPRLKWTWWYAPRDAGARLILVATKLLSDRHAVGRWTRTGRWAGL
jgi:hypothetical protein